MLSVKQDLLAALAAELETLTPGAGAKAAFESPKVASHGDFACTAAMQLAKPLKLNPRQVAEGLRTALLATPVYQRWVADIDIAGPGFINIRLKPAAKQEIVREVLAAGERFGFQGPRNARVLVEFVSANPTGPLHVGHGRQAAIGDAISNLFATQGWSVHREFYYNDAGVQIQTLAHSTQLRAKGFKPGDECWPIDPENPASKAFYNGDYIADIAEAFKAKATVKADDREFTANGDVEDYDNIRQFAVAYLRNEQDKDLQAFNLHFDEYYLESSLYTSGRVEATVNKLVANGKTYEQDGALWLKTTDYGDDKDRVMRKTDGGYTYFVPDVAYHITKWERGFPKVVNIQGTDHHGTIARVRAGLQDADLSALDGPQAQALMLQLAKYPAMLTAATEGEAPHDVTFYLRDLAASYHSYYDAERILVDDETVKRARLARGRWRWRSGAQGCGPVGAGRPAGPDPDAAAGQISRDADCCG